MDTPLLDHCHQEQRLKMHQDIVSRIEPTFHSSSITAGNDINLVYNNVVNRSEISILARLNAALKPITSASYDSFEAKQRSECFPNTRVQVLNDIETWINDTSHQAPIYVLDGVAGIGKSTIAQTIAVRAAAQGQLGASFFFSRDEDFRRIARHFFPTIAYQLGCHDEKIANYISDSLDQHPDAPSKRLRQQLSLILLDPLQQWLPQRTKPTLIIMDALDECEEDNGEELLLLLAQNAYQMKGLKILITTRPESHTIRDILDQDHNHEIFRLHEIDESIVRSDIRLYLRSRLSVEEIHKVSRTRRKPWQPTANDMEMLCGMCGTLFIIAATAIKFILDRKQLNPEKQLSRLLDGVSASGFSASKYANVLDETYIRIILAARSDLDEGYKEWFRTLNKVLGALIILAKPLPCSALASLLNMDPDDVETTLTHLHSLVAPSGSGENMIFRIHHQSFPDFVTDKERIRQVLKNRKSRTHPGLDSLLWVDLGEQHVRLAKACFRIMYRDLKWNIAGISQADFYKDKDDIPHVSPHLISRKLAYSALHWASHLLSARRLHEEKELQQHLHMLLSRRILAWIEVMIILNQVNEIYGILQVAIESMSYIKDNAWVSRARVQELISDTSRFVLQGSQVMKLSTMHLYRSCLPFIPTDTSLYSAYYTRATMKVGLERSYQWDPLLVTLIGHSGLVYSVAFSGDGSLLASGSGDKTVRLWDAKTGIHISTLTGHSNQVRSVAFSSDGSRLASGASDRTIRLWDAKTSEHLASLTGHTGSAVRSVAFSCDGAQLASGSDDNTIRLWNAKTGAHVSTLTGHSGWVNSVTFSRNGSRLASGSSDTTIRLWNPKTGTRLFTLIGHSDWVNSVAFSRDGSRLASGSDDKTIRIWNVRLGRHISTVTGHSGSVYSVVFSGDDSRLASGSSDNTSRLWDSKTGRQISTLVGHVGSVLSVGISKDGSQLASGSDDEMIRLWDAKTGANSSNFAHHWGPVNSVAFSNDGSRLVAKSGHNTCRVWDTRTGAHISTLTAHSHFIHTPDPLELSENQSRRAYVSNGRIVRFRYAHGDIPTLTAPSNSTIKSVVFLGNIHKLVKYHASFSYQLLRWPMAGHISLLLLVKRETPPITGLIEAKLSYQAKKWEVVPACWFPPDVEVESFAYNHMNSQVVVGCTSGRVMLLDFLYLGPFLLGNSR